MGLHTFLTSLIGAYFILIFLNALATEGEGARGSIILEDLTLGFFFREFTILADQEVNLKHVSKILPFTQYKLAPKYWYFYLHQLSLQRNTSICLRVVFSW